MASDGTGQLLWQAANRWQAAQRAALKPFGLTHVQFLLLDALVSLTSDGPVNQRMLAEYAAIDAMMTSQVVRVLASSGWVTRRVDPEDARSWALAVTRKGSALAVRAAAAVEKCDAAFFATLGGRQASLRSALRALRDA